MDALVVLYLIIHLVVQQLLAVLRFVLLGLIRIKILLELQLMVVRHVFKAHNLY